MSNALDPSTSTSASPSTRRSNRPKRSSDTPKPSLVSSVWDTEMSESRGTFPNLGDSTSRRNAQISHSNPRPWMHPQELRYICDEDFPQNVLIQYLCSKAFSIPPREINSAISLFHITTHRGTTVGLPRGYRVPLMFVAKFQWDSLKLVLTSPDPQKEWDEYKFDLIHLCRLCERLFIQAEEAQKQAVAAGTKGLDRFWRSATFDRVLTRFYHRWFVCREWSIRKFWEEFDDDEYDGDKLKHDWARWAVKGHKGFTLTKDQIQGGITAQQFMHGLSKTPQGAWTWDESLPLSSVAPPNSQSPIGSLSLITDGHPIVVEDETNSNGTSISQLEKLFDVHLGTETPSHNTIEVKRERLEVAGENVDVPDPILPVMVSARLESSRSDAVTPPVVGSVGRRLPNNISTNTNNPLGGAEHSTSPIVGQKRPRSPVSNQRRKIMVHARKSMPIEWHRAREQARKSAMGSKPKSNPAKPFSFGRYLEKFKTRDTAQLLENKCPFESSSSSDGSSEDRDDPKDDDYRGPRTSRAKARRLSSKPDSTTRHTPPLTVVVKIPTTSGPKDDQTMGAGSNPAVVATRFKVIPASINLQDSPSVAVPSSVPVEPNSPPSESERLVTDQVTGSPSVTTISESLGHTTATTQALSSGAGALPISESRQSAPIFSTADLVSPTHDAPPPLPPSPSSQNGLPTFVNSSNPNSQENSAALSPVSPGTVADQFTQPQNASEAVSEGGLVKEILSDLFPVAEMSGNGRLNIVIPDVVDAGSSIDRHGDHPMCSAGAVTTSSMTDVQTSPLTEVAPQTCFSSSAPKQVDHMDVDEPVTTSETVGDLHEMLTSILSDPRETKVRHAIFLLRSLLRGQNVQSGSILTAVDGDDPFISARHLLSSDTFADGEESFTMEEHLELVVECSSLLSKFVTVYKGLDLEERMIHLDERLHQELSNMGIVPRSGTEPHVITTHPPVRVDKAIATMLPEDDSELPDRGQDIMGSQVENPDGIMQDSGTDTIPRQSLTPEATMVDLSSVPPTTTLTDPDILKIELVSGAIPPASRLVTSMMRNLANLLDSTCGGDGIDLKGKGRASDIVTSATIRPPCDLPPVGPFLDDFKSTNEEMRKSQHWSKEGIESIAQLHRAEVILLREQVRAIENNYRRDTDLIRQRHREEMDSLMGVFHEAEKQREKATVETEGKLPLLEMLELRRRVTALESYTRTLTTSASQAGPSSRPACEDESDITIIRRPPFHPLGHLFDFEDVASPLSYRSPNGTFASTPIQSESSNAVLIDSIPLPIKSQRKFQSMHRIALT